ncbi:Hypothetical predicted protein [Pelobates cultripes]|uniref:Uncharacterized protein n=1 Tax=Pelobates cultripes TaxID=61616 RepID=A0AAD1TRE2_PELCU|nr:Hypothetical predicted protein [Pelobates cultripes]CAH2330755.1 Hypothetical predicted protein [Pelobates cultripes]
MAVMTSRSLSPSNDTSLERSTRKCSDTQAPPSGRAFRLWGKYGGRLEKEPREEQTNNIHSVQKKSSSGKLQHSRASGSFTMKTNKDPMTETILNLTLEIIYLLTGEVRDSG